jgi:hypothetical protein
MIVIIVLYYWLYDRKTFKKQATGGADVIKLFTAASYEFSQ